MWFAGFSSLFLQRRSKTGSSKSVGAGTSDSICTAEFSARLCLNLRLSQCGRSLFGLLFLLLLRLLGSNVLRTFFVVLGRKRLRRRVKSRMPRRGGRNRRTSGQWSLLFVHGRCEASACLNNKCKQKIICTVKTGERREVCDCFSSEKVAGGSKESLSGQQELN